MASRNNILTSEPVWYLKCIPYYSYLNTRHWKRFRDGYITHLRETESVLTCSRCGISTIGVMQVRTQMEDGSEYIQTVAEEPVWNVHHLTYERLGEEEFSDVTLLCVMCHNLEHHPESHAAKRWEGHLEHQKWIDATVQRLEQGI